MIPRKHIYRKTVKQLELQPYISTGERIRRMIDTGVVDYVPTPPNFDDQPNNPTKSMVVDPTKQPCQDPFTLSEKLGETARKAIERNALKNGTTEAGQAQPEGA